jgi:peptide/nickel transport system permease protein
MAYLRDRIIQAAITLFGVVTLGFFLNRLLPGGPVDYLRQDIRANPRQYGLPPNPTPEQINRVIQRLIEFDPDQPLHLAYLEYVQQVFLHFDLGESIIVAPGASVEQLMLNAAPWTIFLSVLGLVWGLLIGIFLGSLMAYYEGSRFDVGTTIVVILDNAIPYYIGAIFLLYVLAFQLGWFPTGGRTDPTTTPGINWPFISGVLYHAALPALSFIITGFGGNALGIRANAIRLIGSEPIRVAKLRGLSPYRISLAYLARNAILPMYTGIIIGLGGLLGGSIILEQIFQYPGMGMLMFEAAIQRDYPLLMGGFLITSFIFVVGTVLADFTYTLIDPRADVKVER